MQTFNFTFESLDQVKQQLADCPLALADGAQSLIQIFNGIHDDLVSYSELATYLSHCLPAALMIGSTTDGEVLDGKIVTGSLVFSITVFNKSQLRGTYAVGKGKSLGRTIAKRLVGSKTKLVVCFIDYGQNGDDFLQGFDSVAQSRVVMVGGLSGDGGSYSQPFLSFGTYLIEHGAVAVAVDSDQLFVKPFMHFGWKKVGAPIRVTRAEKNRVYELDYQPALSVYRRYMGSVFDEKMNELIMSFPLMLSGESGWYARAGTKIHADGSISYAGNVSENQKVYFGFVNEHNLIKDNGRFHNQFLQTPVESIFVYSCMARRRLLKLEAAKELAMFADRAPMSGFFTYGEFFYQEGRHRLLNQALTGVFIAESAEQEGYFQRASHGFKLPATSYSFMESESSFLIQTSVLTNIVQMGISKLEEEQSFFKYFMNSHQIGLLKFNATADGHNLDLDSPLKTNSILLKMLGIGKADIPLYQTISFRDWISCFVMQEDRHKAFALLEQLFQDSGAERTVVSVQRRDGRQLYLRMQAKLLVQSSTETEIFICELEDVSEAILLSHLEVSLSQGQEYDTVFLAVLDQNTHDLLYANGHFFGLFGKDCYDYENLAFFQDSVFEGLGLDQKKFEGRLNRVVQGEERIQLSDLMLAASRIRWSMQRIVFHSRPVVLMVGRSMDLELSEKNR